MKFQLMFKTNDVLDQVDGQIGGDGVKDDEDIQQDIDEMKEFCSKYIKWGEYVTIEFDSDTQTVTVLEAR